MIFLLTIAFVAIGLFEIPALVRNKHWRELAVFSVFFVLAFILALLQAADVKIPSPVKGMEYLFKDILKLSYY
ncbi:hypothetical protein DEHRE_04720 [Dehalobacter restrictus DSM 9455]|uniref:Uncharacterized protein n=1 Tax=Dehalobacter restrictus (strain DSM 9455 / PER-K23) TaxID=871738 RepID=A0ABN4BTX5_DEHRP|nr:hypothetical protein DEHRE_04720 [Dehalobacter restrictus DSM 9455]